MKSLRIYIIVLSALLVVYLVAQYNRPKPVDWSSSYSKDDKIPFGTYVLYNRIGDILPRAQVVSSREPFYNVLHNYGTQHGAYIIIADGVNPSKYDTEALADFVNAGNDVFIAASYLGEALQKKFKLGTQLAFDDKRTPVRFVNKYLDSAHNYNVGHSAGALYYDKIDTAHATVLGFNKSRQPNFVKYRVGKGNIYFNANPIFFTNYSILNKEGEAYAAKALSYLKPTNKVIWDQYAALGSDDDDSTMRVFLRYPTLRWAFYLSVFSLLVFVLYEAKRRQRIIPVIDPLRNETADFVTTVGNVYFERHDNADIAIKKINYFADFLRASLQLNANLDDPDFYDRLVQKSGVEPGLVRNLLDHIIYLGQQQTVTDQELIVLNNLIDKFYAKTK